MDFVTKLIAGSPSKGSGASNANDPDRRLGRFKREYKHLLQIWQSATNLSRDQDAIEEVRRAIQELKAILRDESRRPSPHVCISYASSEKIYVAVGKIATTSYNESIIREAVAFFSTLIESEEEDFLENKAFSQSLMRLVIRITGPKRIAMGPGTGVEIVELGLRIATKIRLQPEILPVWFITQGEDSGDKQVDAHEKFVGRTLKNEFPLFYLLIEQIHEDGRIGEFARTGLLYIIESASTSLALEQWLVESDLATLMASGLQAQYSRTRVKLVIDYPPEDVPLILTLSDYERPIPTGDVFSSTDGDYLECMETFLQHLAFWQDVLDHCKSVEVKQTLLDHFKVIVLQQVLYPSLLQSSDIDGGSSVAVITCLRRILELLDHPDMIHLILHYLLALPDTVPSRVPGSRIVSAARKRKSMDLANMMASQSEEQASPDLYNLVDLIRDCLRSGIQQTIAVTLQLVSVILRRHHQYAVTTLLRTARLMTDGPQTTVGAHEREMEFLLSLANDIGGDENLDEAYENCVRDSMVMLESHPCSQVLIIPKTGNDVSKLPGAQPSIPGGPRDVRPHTLRTDDPILRTMLGMFETFFTNPVETNLCLTATIIDLAACGFMSIEGWILPDPSNYIYRNSDEAEDLTMSFTGSMNDSFEATKDSKLRAIRKARRIPHWPPPVMPKLLDHLQTLVSHISVYRSAVPRFDDLLQRRRQALHTPAAQNTQTPAQQKLRSSFDSSPSRTASPQPAKQSAFNSLAQQIFPGLASPSRSSSPRGRRSQEQQRSSISSPTPAPIPTGSTPRIAPPQFPMRSSRDSPSRGSSREFSSSPLRGSESTATASKGIASQAAAFAEIEKAILARKIGIPTAKGELIPPPFPNLAPNLQEQESPVAAETDDIANSGIDTTSRDRSDDEDTGSEEYSEAQEEIAPDVEKEEKLVSVSHVLTNAIVLQEFLLELAALVQVRAGLFGEIKFL